MPFLTRTEIEDLVERHHSAAIALARRLFAGAALPPSLGRDDLESVALLAMLKAARAFDPCHRPRARFWTYAYPGIRGAVLDAVRRETLRTLPTGGDVAEVPGRTATDPPNHRGCHAIRAILRGLPERSKRILIRHYIYGDSQQEIAQRIGVRQATVSRIMTKAVRWLRVHRSREELWNLIERD